ncbi:hypothetical protein ACFQFC_34800 [Amorphoplanes digitatis]|uniref:Uncharacterized protein n=1 Tax=Actinoplanes digitatis TaxID=1868 RepID=A0A7W7HV65_9ACTN|nr:hypothetical protein [Actinoplanes digitatis]MBB4761335.1 hypothetical protein [Actinoplanes digitatis]BFE69742.1 hypothetical protein GCM10020092_030430 [Actinoplanes digitatis]GID92952.1 hypothetical protein Adi01nite_23640 [Actinoplanes digitatis]
MLDASSVDWTAFPDIYGETGEVLPALRAIRSADADTRRAAYEDLAGRLVSQGSRSAPARSRRAS